jgi:hypothetical protein
MSAFEETLAIDHGEALGADVVGQILLVPTAMIAVRERLRPIDPVWAEALGQVMRREGQRTPVEICRLPGSDRWTLVAGGHRLEGARMAGIEYLRAEVVSADRDDRRLREVSENLWRKGLEPIDRAAFAAELVAIHKRRAGIDPSKNGRSVSADVRWKHAVSDEADDANVTLTVAYGWTDDVAAELGWSKSKLERDLTLYRRLAASLVEQLRAARHPIVTNGSQLRALAKLDEPDQRRAVERLLSGEAKSVGDALKADGSKSVNDAATKRLSTILNTLGNMSAIELRGLFQSPQFHALIPDEAQRLLAPMRRDLGESTDG